MPHATFAYPFEGVVHGFARELAERFAGPKGRGTFLLVLDADGSLVSMNFLPPPTGWHEQCEALRAAGTPHLLYDPFDAPEYTWLSWFGIARPAMERMMSKRFSAGDFVRLSIAMAHARELPRPDFPESWGVMF